MHWPNDKTAIQEVYRRDGFVIIKRLYDPRQVGDLRLQLQQYIHDVVPRVPAMDAFFEDPLARKQIRMLSRMERHDPRFHALLTSGVLPSIAEALCGQRVVPHDMAYFNKLPKIGEATPPHQDGYYFHIQPSEALTLWLALDVADEDNGCMRYARGSHRRGMREHARTQVLGFSQGIVDYDRDDMLNEVAACVSAGDLIVHHALTIHRTGANASNRPRRALGFVYFAASASVDQQSIAEYQAKLAAEWKTSGKL